MGKKGSAPAAPDYTAAAQATGESNKENLASQTYANRPNQYTPWSSTEWSNDAVWDPASEQYVTQWSQDTNVSPDAQRAIDSQIGLQAGRSELGESMMGRAEGDFGEAIDWNKFSQAGGTPEYQQGNRLELDQFQAADDNRQGVGAIRNRAEDAIYDRSASRLDPQWTQAQDNKEAQMVAQGLRPNDPAWNQEMENFNRSKTDAYQQAQYGAIMGGGEEAQRQFGMQSDRYNQDFDSAMKSQGFNTDQTAKMYGANQNYNQQNFANSLTQSNYQNTLRQQEIAEEMQKRGASLNEINALISGQQVAMPNAPQFNSSGMAAPVDFSGAAQNQYSGALDAYSADQAQSQGMMSGLGSLAGTGASMFMMSDRRLKTKIKKIGHQMGLNVYEWVYTWGEASVGYMADEVKKLYPDAVYTNAQGFDYVDYGAIK